MLGYDSIDHFRVSRAGRVSVGFPSLAPNLMLAPDSLALVFEYATWQEKELRFACVCKDWRKQARIETRGPAPQQYCSLLVEDLTSDGVIMQLRAAVGLQCAPIKTTSRSRRRRAALDSAEIAQIQQKLAMTKRPQLVRCNHVEHFYFIRSLSL